MYDFPYLYSHNLDVFLQCEGMDFKWSIKKYNELQSRYVQNVWQCRFKLVMKTGRTNYFNKKSVRGSLGGSIS